ncbi:MAG: TetR family transcriptional regulator [Phenylobacterium sp.]|nr:TetR family transcriptional regulator [Phenylobacterium sp.]
MVTEFSGAGDLRRSIELLWGVTGQGRRGPKPSRSVEEVVLAAIGIADAEGLPALSMRRVAEALGLSPMSLYTYVPSKAELVDLMLDQAAMEIEEPSPALPGWRAKVEHLARQRWAMAQRHPWIMQVGAHRPPLGPNVLAKAEATLQAIDGLGLDDQEMNLLTGLIGAYVRGVARAALEAREAEQASGISNEEWWATNAELLQGLIDPARYPTTLRVGQSHRATREVGLDPERHFEFGLQRVLDGMEVFIASRRPAAV